MTEDTVSSVPTPEVRRGAATGMRVLSLATILIGMAAHTAFGQSAARQWAWCRGEDPTLIQRGCDALIGSGRETSANLARAYFHRGRHWNDLGQYRRAIADFDQAIKRDGAYPEAYDNRGLAYRGLGLDEQALRDFDEAVRLDPNYAIALFNRATTHRHMGHEAEAAADFARARESGPRRTAPKE